MQPKKEKIVHRHFPEHRRPENAAGLCGEHTLDDATLAQISEAA
jgi:hypothetical protein